MAKKSKTQRAKASAARSQRKEQQAIEAAEALAKAEASANEPVAEKKPKRTFFKKAAPQDEATESKAVAKASSSEKKPEKKAEKKPPKKKRFQFLRDVRTEMKRVTWPTKTDVLRWSVVVVVALAFFGVYVALLDNVVVTPLLFLVSGLG